MRKFPEAAAAYEKLNKLVPNEPDLLADYADALAMSQGRDLERQADANWCRRR